MVISTIESIPDERWLLGIPMGYIKDICPKLTVPGQVISPMSLVTVSAVEDYSDGSMTKKIAFGLTKLNGSFVPLEYSDLKCLGVEHPLVQFIMHLNSQLQQIK